MTMVGTQGMKTVIGALVAVLAAMVVAVPAAAHDAPPDEHEGGGPEMSGYGVWHQGDNKPPWLVAIQLDEWGHVTEQVIGAIRPSGASTTPACTREFPGWCSEPTEGSLGGLAFGPDGTLFGVEGGPEGEYLVTISSGSGTATRVGSLGGTAGVGPLTFDCAGDLWMTSAPGDATTDRSSPLYSVDPGTGAATEAGRLGHPVVGLAARGDTVFGLGRHYRTEWQGWAGPRDADLLAIDTSTVSAAQVGPLTNANVERGALAFAPDGTLWGVGTAPSPHRELLFSVDADTGAATVLAETDWDYEALAIRGGSGCGEGVSAAAGGNTAADVGSEGGVVPSGGEASESARDPSGSRPENGRADSLSSADRSEDGAVADRAPTVEGVGVAGDPDAVAGQASDWGAADGWAAGLVAALIVGGFVLGGLAGRSRLRRS